jgi:hypothetical protein
MFYLTNHYPATVWLSIQWNDARCQGQPWRTVGWFQFEPGETAWCNIPELRDLRSIGNSHFYYFIESSDGAFWAGPFPTNCPDDAYNWCLDQNSPSARSLGFRELIVTTADFTLTTIPLSGHSIIGNWKTTVLNIDINMTLTESGAGVSGSATTSLGPQVFAVTGSHSDPNVALQSQLDARTALVFNGAFSDNNTISGSFTLGTDSGLATLRRV